MSHSSALSAIKAVGIGISSSGGCSNRNQPTCTSLEQVNCNAINCMKTLKSSSGCPITITGGTVRRTNLIVKIRRTHLVHMLLFCRKLVTPRVPTRITMVTRSIFHSTHASIRTLPNNFPTLVNVVMERLNTKRQVAIFMLRKAITGTSPSLPIAKHVFVFGCQRRSKKSILCV